MKNTWTNKILILIVVCLLFFLSLQKCKNTFTEVITTTKVETVIDTTHVSVIDTIPLYVDSVVLQYLPIIGEEVSLDSSEFYYSTAVNDSLLAGKIFTTVASDGTLVQQDFTYLPKFPKYIYQIDTFWIDKTVTITNTIQEQDWGLYGGLMVSPYKNLSITGTLGLKTKKDLYFGVGYEPFQQNMYIDFKFPIIKNKNYANKTRN